MLKQKIIKRYYGNSESLLDDDESFESFAKRVLDEANKFSGLTDNETNIHYVNERIAVIIYKEKEC